jgi:hypothetical protein
LTNKCNNGGMPDKLSILRRLSDDVSWFVDLSLPRLKLRQYGPDSHCKELAEAFPTSDQLGVLGRFKDDQQPGSGNGQDESWLVAPQQSDYHGNVAKNSKFLLDILSVRELSSMEQPRPGDGTLTSPGIDVQGKAERCLLWRQRYSEKDFGPTILARFSGIVAEQFTIRTVIGFDSLCQLAMILHKISAL